MAKKRFNSKAKGSRAEYAVRDAFSLWWQCEFRRTPGSGAWGTTHNQGSLVGDVVCDDPAFPYSIEIKNQEKWCLEHLLSTDKAKLLEWWTQTLVQAAASKKKPMLCFTRNRQPIFIMTLKTDAPKDLKGDRFTLQLGKNTYSIFLLTQLLKTDANKCRVEKPLL